MKSINLPNGTWQYDDSYTLGNPGGFAVVHAGLSAGGASVAIKIFHPHKHGDASRELEFARAQVGKPLSYVIPIHDCGVESITGQPVIVMSRGDSNLAQHVAEAGQLTEAEACTVALQIVQGLLEVPEWIHRDLKPQNVIRCDGRWQLADFGIARLADALTASRTMKGYLSLHYAAPEQWNADTATHKTDVYALGCIIHELLTGIPLFKGPDQDDFARQHRYELPKLLAGSPRLRSLLQSMLAKPGTVRPTLQALKDRLETFVNTGESRPPSPLAHASAVVSEQEARHQAELALARRGESDRRELCEHAVRILDQISKELFNYIREEAPAAIIASDRLSRSAALGSGTLIMSVGHQTDIPPHQFPSSGWDVACWDYIQVEQPGYKRSASLWYVNVGSGTWQWLEVAYYRWLGRGDPAAEPCALHPGRDADLAAGMGTHVWQLAHALQHVEGAGTDVFFKRWISYLAEAAERRLGRPSHLPETF